MTTDPTTTATVADRMAVDPMVVRADATLTEAIPVAPEGTPDA